MESRVVVRYFPSFIIILFFFLLLFHRGRELEGGERGGGRGGRRWREGYKVIVAVTFLAIAGCWDSISRVESNRW